MKLFKLVVYVPLSHADQVRQALGSAGAGRLGNYSHCSFSIRGTGRFKPLKDAKPFIGEAGGQVQTVQEQAVGVVVEQTCLRDTLKAMRKAHPYEEVAFDLFEMADFSKYDQ